MLELVQNLADRLVAKAPTVLRIAFNEEDRTKDPQPEAAHFLKFNLDGDERRMGRDLELYGFMAKVGGESLPVTMMLGELVLPLKGYSPEAFTEGIAFMRENSSVMGDKAQEWNELLDSISK